MIFIPISQLTKPRQTKESGDLPKVTQLAEQQSWDVNPGQQAPELGGTTRWCWAA